MLANHVNAFQLYIQNPVNKLKGDLGFENKTKINKCNLKMQ